MHAHSSNDPSSVPSVRRIAVCVDGSSHADRALTFALDLARRYGSELTVLTVAQMLPYGAAPEALLPADTEASEVGHAREVLDRALARARAHGADRVEGVVLEGRVADELVAYLEEHPADLVVLGSRGLSAAKRLLLGSTSSEVLHRVSCPVLIVRGPPGSPAS
jgi:nucleotide-binding universal stress UspA family protein